MPKRYFEIKEISKEAYFKKAKDYGKTENEALVRGTAGGSMQANKDTFLAYTAEDVLEVELYYEEMD